MVILRHNFNLKNMKKILLFFVVVSMGLISCSSDDNSGEMNANLTVTIDGERKVFNTIVVDAYDNPEGEFSFRSVTATINNDPTELITFSISNFSKGSGAMQDIQYILNGGSYSLMSNEANFSSVVEESKEGRMKGVFTGALTKIDFVDNEFETIKVTLTEGSFDINYKK